MKTIDIFEFFVIILFIIYINPKGWLGLKDMIEQIISTDRKSRESIERTKQIRIQSAQKISDIREKKREEYLEKARANIEVVAEEERARADLKLKAIERVYRGIEEEINEVYEENYQLWVDALVRRVIEG